MLHLAVHELLLLLLPPLLLGVIGKTKAAFAGRTGPPLLQPYYDLVRLFQKGSVFSSTTTWVFRAGPAVGLAAALLAGQLVPLGRHAAPVSFPGDVILFVYLFALARFTITAAALDTGSAFEGMGAAREASFGSLAEPALLFGLLALARLAGAFSLGAMLHDPWGAGRLARGPSLVLIAASWSLVFLAENCRLPFDDPNTHLELTMIHEVMVLDHSGPAFGVILYSAAMKLFVLGALLLHVLSPLGGSEPWVDWAVFVAGMLLLAVAIGVVESVMARLRLARVPQALVTASVLSAFGMLLLVR
ncbi:MAG TPA: NADH-quinone oxidoreductase subunit H [Thermoanaerobaculia bacterium]|nr:NADH-quinone oxidoreductase subunit H [Thermoanaerobaculia bacterium]